MECRNGNSVKKCPACRTNQEKLDKGKSISRIAKELEETEELIQEYGLDKMMDSANLYIREAGYEKRNE